MAHLSSLHLERFRSLDRLNLRELGQINVLLGRNNSGKSSVLEAVELLLQQGNPSLLVRLPFERGQTFSENGEEYADVSEFFLGRPGATSEPILSLAGQRLQGAGPLTLSLAMRPSQLEVSSMSEKFKLPLTSGRGVSPRQASTQPLANVVSLGSGGGDQARLRTAWSALVGNPGEDLAAAALRTIDPHIERVVLAPGGQGWSGWFVKREGGATREPISGEGEGLKRLLSIAVGLAKAEKGTLLIDEVENGMHHEVVPSFWRFLVGTARNLGVQVFMTSHSRDLIDGFGVAQSAAREEFEGVAFYRLERGKSEAVRVSHRVAASVGETRQEIR